MSGGHSSSNSQNLSSVDYDPIALGPGSSYIQKGSTGNGPSTFDASSSSSGASFGVTLNLTPHSTSLGFLQNLQMDRHFNTLQQLNMLGSIEHSAVGAAKEFGHAAVKGAGAAAGAAVVGLIIAA